MLRGTSSLSPALSHHVSKSTMSDHAPNTPSEYYMGYSQDHILLHDELDPVPQTRSYATDVQEIKGVPPFVHQTPLKDPHKLSDCIPELMDPTMVGYIHSESLDTSMPVFLHPLWVSFHHTLRNWE